MKSKIKSAGSDELQTAQLRPVKSVAVVGRKVKSNGPGWIKLMRNPDLPELVRTNPNAFLVALIIAYRARWNPKAKNFHELAMGEAIVDYENWGLSEGRFRRGLAALKAWSYAKSRTTNRGTIAHFVNTELFCVVAGLHDEQNEEQTDEQTKSQPKTNKEVKKLRAKSEAPSFDDDDDFFTRANVTREQWGPKATKKGFLELAHSLGLNGESEALYQHFCASNWCDDYGKRIRSPRPYLIKCEDNPPKSPVPNKGRESKARLTRVPVNGGVR